MSTQHESTSGATIKPRRKSGLWWVVGGGVLALTLVAVAAIAIPRILHANRVADYHATIARTEALLDEAHYARIEAERVTVVYALQFDEALDYLDDLEKLAGYTDHYFSPEHLERLGNAHDTLAVALESDGLSEAEATVTAAAKDTIETQGIVWQTAALNLGSEVADVLVEHADRVASEPVPDEAVTDGVLEQARGALLAAETELLDADKALERVVDRSATFTTAIVGTLGVVSDAALAAPDQAEVMLGVYANAGAEISGLMRDSAKFAAAATGADLFTLNDNYDTIPVISEVPTDQPTFSATEAWRAVLIAAHLREYSDAITVAWLAERGGFSELIGPGPFGYPF